MDLTEEQQYLDYLELLQERITQLELALEDVSWIRLAAESEREFSRDGLRQICLISRIIYLKNPLIQRGVDVQADYVFGQGMTIKAEAKPVNEIVQAFLDDAKNQAELTSHQSRIGKEVELSLAGNIFFVLFPNIASGRVRVRTIPVDEISEIITNPEDAKDPWFYKRNWSENRVDLDKGISEIKTRTAYYPDWRYTPAQRPARIGTDLVMWESPVYHVRTGGLPDMRFGVPEVYAAIDWAMAYKNFLEDWATIVRAYSRFAWQLVIKGGKSALAAAKTKLQSTLSSSTGESNPPPTTGSTFIASENANLAPLRTAGATTSADDGRRLLLMVAATMGLPETFFGDTSVGTLATARSLDRPTELKFLSRQTFWADIFKAILYYVIYWAVKAGLLPGSIAEEDDGTPKVELANDPETGEPMSAAIQIDFPPILEHDVAASVTAIAQADMTGKVDDQTISRLLLQALGVDDIEAALEKLYPEDGEAPEADQEEAAMIEAMRDLRQAVTALKEKYAPAD